MHVYTRAAGFTVPSEDYNDGTGTFELGKTYVPGLAEIMGDETDLASGTPGLRFLTHDHLGSTRGVSEGTKARTA